MYNVVAYQVAGTINLKESKKQLPWQLLFQDSDELYFQVSEQAFLYLFQYGMVSFFNLKAEEISELLAQIKPFCSDYFTENFSENVDVKIEPNKLNVQFNLIVLPKLDQEMIRLVMMNASQSVALDRYSEITENLIIETNRHTLFLEKHGRINISGKNLKRFIGKILNIKNKISENLYIFDSPDITWENEVLNKLNIELKMVFDLKDRYRLIHDRVDIIKENLELFKDIMDHKESSRLEWIIIILIIIEVFDMLLLKLV